MQYTIPYNFLYQSPLLEYSYKKQTLNTFNTLIHLQYIYLLYLAPGKDTTYTKLIKQNMPELITEYHINL